MEAKLWIGAKITTSMQNPHYYGIKIHKRHGTADLELFAENI